MTKELISKEEGYLTKDKTLFFPKAELINIGCKNCVWKLHNQCPHNLTRTTDADRVHGAALVALSYGICNEMIQFLVSLADKDDSVSAVWEKFYLYKAKIEESIDYAEYKNLQKEIQVMEKNALEQGRDDESKELLEQIKMKRTAAKMWWIRLHEHIAKSLQKVVDREYKGKEKSNLPGILQAKEINFNIVKDDKK